MRALFHAYRRRHNGPAGTIGPYLGTSEPEVCVYNSTDHAYQPTPKGDYDCWTNPSSISDVLQMFYDDCYTAF